jgi:hypothetical protein
LALDQGAIGNQGFLRRGVTSFIPIQLLAQGAIADGSSIRGYEVEELLEVGFGWHGGTLANPDGQASGAGWW